MWGKPSSPMAYASTETLPFKARKFWLLMVALHAPLTGLQEPRTPAQMQPPSATKFTARPSGPRSLKRAAGGFQGYACGSGGNELDGACRGSGKFQGGRRINDAAHRGRDDIGSSTAVVPIGCDRHAARPGQHAGSEHGLAAARAGGGEG